MGGVVAHAKSSKRGSAGGLLLSQSCIMRGSRNGRFCAEGRDLVVNNSPHRYTGTPVLHLEYTCKHSEYTYIKKNDSHPNDATTSCWNRRHHNKTNAIVFPIQPFPFAKAIIYAESLWCTQRKTPTKNQRLPSCLLALPSKTFCLFDNTPVVASTSQRIMIPHEYNNYNNSNNKNDASVLWPLSVIPSTAEDYYEIPIFDETISSSSSSYLVPNQPCLLRGRQLLDKYFGSLHQQWRVLEPDTLVSSYYHHHTIIIHHVYHVKDGRHDLVVQNVTNLLVQVSAGC